MGFRWPFTLKTVLFVINSVIAQTCDYSQFVSLGQTYYIYNAEYPNKYQGAQYCRWLATSLENTKIVITCNDTNTCEKEHLLVSLTGNASFIDAQRYCGFDTLSVTSSSNSLAIALIAPSDTQGGRFACSLAAAQIQSCQCGWQASTKIGKEKSNATAGAGRVLKEFRKINGSARTEGGQDALSNEFPLMAGLIDTSNQQVFCGATILSLRYALTAAHCSSSSRRIASTGLLIGDTTLSQADKTTSDAIYEISKFIQHEDYNSTTNKNDIAIIRTQTPINMGLYVGTACLPFQYSGINFTEQTVVALGWGLLYFSGPSADTLQKVNLLVISNDQCNQLFPQPIDSSQLCTYSEGKDTYNGDSGGPLLWKDPYNRLHVVGIISFGAVCGSEVPTVNTRLSSYLTWIAAHTPVLRHKRDIKGFTYLNPENGRLYMKTTSCTNDRLLVSLTGNPSLTDAQSYCGSGTLSITSNSNALAVALVAPSNSQGGRFVCSLAAAQIQSCSCGWQAASNTIKESPNVSNFTLQGTAEVESNGEIEKEFPKKPVLTGQLRANEAQKLGGRRGIVGGEDSLPNEFPLMSALIDISTSSVFCGSSILSPRYVLTAAHCYSSSRPTSSVRLLVGDTTLSEANETPAAALYAISQFILHENYNPNTNENDIALIYTLSNIALSLYVGPTCLPFAYSQFSYVGQSVTALGWGLLEFSGAPADTLQKVDLPVISNTQCSQSFQQTVYNSQLCTYTSGKDTCLGDSGGPLLWYDSYGRLQLVGIVSYGGVCASDTPAINTRITSYLTWIVSKAPSVIYCA